MAINSAILSEVASVVGDPSFRSYAQSIFLSVLNDSQDEIVSELECLQSIDTSLVLVANTGEYDAPSTFLKFPSRGVDGTEGMITLGTNGTVQLEHTSVELLNTHEPGWRSVDAGSPRQVYLIEGSTVTIGFHPKPSANFISDKGSTVHVRQVLIPTEIGNDNNLPFNNSPRLRFLHRLLKLKAIATMRAYDRKFEDALSYEQLYERQLDRDREKVNTLFPLFGNVSFHPRYGAL